MDLNELLNRIMLLLAFAGIVLAFRHLDAQAKARKKYRKPKYKQFKIE